MEKLKPKIPSMEGNTRVFLLCTTDCVYANENTGALLVSQYWIGLQLQIF